MQVGLGCLRLETFETDSVITLPGDQLEVVSQFKGSVFTSDCTLDPDITFVW